MLVLHVIESLRQGGKERQLIELVRGLSEQSDVENVILVLSDELYYVQDPKDRGLPIVTFNRRQRKDWRPAVFIYREIRRLRPDVVHVWDSLAAVYAALPSRLFGVKVVNGMIRNAPNNLQFSSQVWRRSRITFPLSNIVLANSHAGLEAFGATGKKARCIHNGFDLRRTERLRPESEVRQRYGLGSGSVVGMVAAFSRRKDYATFFEAARRIVLKWSDVRFVAAGHGETLDHFRQQIPPKLSGRIVLPGSVRDVESLTNTFTIGVLATDTRVHGEGIPNAIMEYMALSKPVVATQSGGTRELVIDGVTGFLVAPGDPTAMSDRLSTLLAEPTLREAMGRTGRSVIEQNFSLDKMVDAYSSLYAQLVQPSRSNGKIHVA